MRRKPFLIVGALALLIALVGIVAGCAYPSSPTPRANTPQASRTAPAGRSIGVRDLATPTPENEVRFCAGGCPDYRATPGCVGGSGVTSGSSSSPGSNQVYACLYGYQPNDFTWSCYAHAVGYGAVVQSFPEQGLSENWSEYCSPFYVNHYTYNTSMSVQVSPFGDHQHGQSFTCGANGNWPPTGCGRIQYYEWNLGDAGANPYTPTPTPTITPTPTPTATANPANFPNMLVEVYPYQPGNTINPSMRSSGVNSTYFRIKCLYSCPIDLNGWTIELYDGSSTLYKTMTIANAHADYDNLYIFMDDLSPGQSIAVPGAALLWNAAATPTPAGFCFYNPAPGADMAYDCGNIMLGTPGAEATPSIR
jgi:hypothetical protein